MVYTKKKFDEKFNDFIVQNYKKEVTDVKIKNNMLLYFEDEAIKSGNIIEYTRKKQCSLSNNTDVSNLFPHHFQNR